MICFRPFIPICFFNADNSGLTYQHTNVHTIEHQLSKDFVNLCEWFVGNKLRIHLCEEKTKYILFSLKLKLKNAEKVNIMYNRIKIKQYSKVTYLGCLLDETMSRESMALKTIEKKIKNESFYIGKISF